MIVPLIRSTNGSNRYLLPELSLTWSLETLNLDFQITSLIQSFHGEAHSCARNHGKYYQTDISFQIQNSCVIPSRGLGSHL